MANPDLQQARLNLEATKEVCRRLGQHAKQIGGSDGSNQEALRAWIQGVDHADVWTGARDSLMLEMIGYLATGSLAVQIWGYIQSAADATWARAREAIIAAFLNEDEREYLRSKVEKVTQNPYEDSREYGRRYREAVNRAYEPADLHLPLIVERLTKQFVQGLRDKSVRTQVFLQRVPTLERAIEAANTAARAVCLAEVDTRGEEPMEVGAMPLLARPDPTGEWSEIRQLLKTLQGEMKSIRKAMTTPPPMTAAHSDQPPPPLDTSLRPTHGNSAAPRRPGMTKIAARGPTPGATSVTVRSTSPGIARNGGEPSRRRSRRLWTMWRPRETKRHVGSTGVHSGESRQGYPEYTRGHRRVPLHAPHGRLAGPLCTEPPCTPPARGPPATVPKWARNSHPGPRRGDPIRKARGLLRHGHSAT